jgi:hypothetical protein
MASLTQVRADVPTDLKLKTFSQLALRNLRFNRWLREKMEGWLEELERQQVTPQDEPCDADHDDHDKANERVWTTSD